MKNKICQFPSSCADPTNSNHYRRYFLFCTPLWSPRIVANQFRIPFGICFFTSASRICTQTYTDRGGWIGRWLCMVISVWIWWRCRRWGTPQVVKVSDIQAQETVVFVYAFEIFRKHMRKPCVLFDLPYYRRCSNFLLPTDLFFKLKKKKTILCNTLMWHP